MFASHNALIYAAVVFALAGFVKGVIGFGLPTVSMGLLSVVILPAEAASLLIIPSMVTNLWLMGTGPTFLTLLRRMWSFLVGVVAGTLLGSVYLNSDMSGNAIIFLGVVLMIYATLGLLSPRFSVPRHMEWWLSPIMGAMTGVVTIETGVFVFPGVPYVQSMGLQRDELVQAMGISATVSTVALATALAMHGIFRGMIAGSSFLALIPVMAGALFGQYVRFRISQKMFRFCFLAGLFLLGGYLMTHLFD